MNRLTNAFYRSPLARNVPAGSSEHSTTKYSVVLPAPSLWSSTRVAGPWRPPASQLELAARTFALFALFALSAGLLVGCSGIEAKRVVEIGEGGESGQGAEGGATVTSGGSSASPGEGGVHNSGDGGAGAADHGSAGAGGALQQGGTAGTTGGGSNGGEPGGTGGGPSSEPQRPVSVCGPGRWSAGEVGCEVCPATRQAFELTCEAYPSAAVFANLGDNLQFALVRLPGGVALHEAPPVDVTVSYISPDESLDESFDSEVLVGTNGWTVDVRAGSAPPAAIVIPPFSALDVCGDTFESLEPVRIDRVGATGSTYVKACP